MKELQKHETFLTKLIHGSKGSVVNCRQNPQKLDKIVEYPPDPTTVECGFWECGNARMLIDESLPDHPL